MNLENKAYTLANGKEYYVIEQVDYEGHTYLYLMNSKDERDTLFREAVRDNNLKFVPIDEDLFDNKLINLFMNKFY